MTFLDLLRLAIRNLREAKLRATLTTMGVIVGVAVIVTMVSFGLGLQRNTVTRFKELDLFNELSVFGKSLDRIITGDNPQVRDQGRRPETPEDRGARGNSDRSPQKVLNDEAIAAISKIPGVAYVEPNVAVSVYARANGRVARLNAGGATIPNKSSRFKSFAVGGMISGPNANEIILAEDTLKRFGFANPQDAFGKSLEFLSPPKQDAQQKKQQEEPPTFFGLPLEGMATTEEENGLVGQSFKIVGVMKDDSKPGVGGGPRVRGLSFDSEAYVPLSAARAWAVEHRNPMTEIALLLARGSGAIGSNETEGYSSAVVRVNDPGVLTNVRKQIADLGFGSFSIVDQLEQIRIVFLILNSVLGLLGGISLLVASFGIANTMIMSILERTREIGIMKAIGAEDREIKMIFFIEAAVIGMAGGIIGSLAAWGIDGIANRITYRFVLLPQGASYIDFFSLPVYLWMGAILFAVGVSILAALYPASRAARIDPVKALRHD
jgi:ABC-type lipoprotein release transport system permease subunit